ncbi:MAG: hypothetical protein WCR85_00360 [Sphaerochaeta sp.]
MTMKKECIESIRYMVQCKDCVNAKRHSYYLTKCNVDGKRVSRNKHIYCDSFVATGKAKKEAQDEGIAVTKTGAWDKYDAPAYVNVKARG